MHWLSAVSLSTPAFSMAGWATASGSRPTSVWAILPPPEPCASMPTASMTESGPRPSVISRMASAMSSWSRRSTAPPPHRPGPPRRGHSAAGADAGLGPRPVGLLADGLRYVIVVAQVDRLDPVAAGHGKPVRNEINAEHPKSLGAGDARGPLGRGRR